MAGLIEALRKLFPDSRPRERTGSIRTPFGEATPVYCASCRKFGGYTFASTEFMFYLCDGCDRFGTGIELPLAEEEVVKKMSREG